MACFILVLTKINLYLLIYFDFKNLYINLTNDISFVLENIKIKFFELDDEDNETWSDYGRFSELDVHHQYAIVFKTPPYKNTDIEENVEVYIKLERPTDGDSSESVTFCYKPSERVGKCMFFYTDLFLY